MIKRTRVSAALLAAGWLGVAVGVAYADDAQKKARLPAPMDREQEIALALVRAC